MTFWFLRGPHCVCTQARVGAEAAMRQRRTSAAAAAPVVLQGDLTLYEVVRAALWSGAAPARGWEVVACQLKGRHSHFRVYTVDSTFTRRCPAAAAVCFSVVRPSPCLSLDDCVPERYRAAVLLAASPRAEARRRRGGRQTFLDIDTGTSSCVSHTCSRRGSCSLCALLSSARADALLLILPLCSRRLRS